MNKTTKEIMKAVQAYKAAIDAHNSEKEKLDKQRHSGSIAPADFSNKTEENNKRLNQAITARLQRFNEIIAEYEQAYEQWATVKGSDVTEDMALLTSGMALDPSDYQSLEEKHAGNYTMVKAIKSHAERNKVSYIASTVIQKEPKVEALLEMISAARSAHSNSNSGIAIDMNSIIFSGDDEFMKYYGQLDRVISLGE
jgi:hypothetical protein